MCGRFALYGPIKLRREAKLEDFGWIDTLVERIVERTPKYNLAPMQTAPIVRVRDDATAVYDIRWGLVAAWAKDVKIGNKAINACVFASALTVRKHSRCLLRPANAKESCARCCT